MALDHEAIYKAYSGTVVTVDDGLELLIKMVILSHLIKQK